MTSSAPLVQLALQWRVERIRKLRALLQVFSGTGSLGRLPIVHPISFSGANNAIQASIDNP